ncbi:MAG: bifunctional phosphoribosyl-AMP cyclohydrolase/phosphoribosyl-ATP diphosphatase HisIE [Clostridia bacterium]
MDMKCDFNLDALKFDENGLIPAAVTESGTGKLLTLAYMNRESLEISLREETTCFWSRSRRQLWRKGETSGNRQHIVRITADCDLDALQVIVEKDGPACHTGADSCFHRILCQSDTRSEFTAEGLMELIAGRKLEKKEGSYTTYLFEKGIDKILKKVGEECTEVIIAGKAGDRKETIYEIADLAYHILVLMTEMGISLEDVRSELASRHVIDKKIKQEKMV